MGKNLVCGWGINDSGYSIRLYEDSGKVSGRRKQKLIWSCPFYQTWSNMVRRCHSLEYKRRYPTYEKCEVSEKWKKFSRFKLWMEDQDYFGKHLDKDLIIKGNKLYSPETCIFVTQQVNNFMVSNLAKRGDFLIGSYFNKKGNKFMSRCNNPFTSKMEFLGNYSSDKEAHFSWQKKKLEHAIALSGLEENRYLGDLLINRYRFKDGEVSLDL